MPKVLCTLPNASENINGVAFSSHPKGMLSEEISAQQAADFAAIPGYTLVDTANPAEAELAALRARGTELNIPFASTKGAAKLKAEIAEAEQKLAAGGAAGGAGGDGGTDGA